MGTALISCCKERAQPNSEAEVCSVGLSCRVPLLDRTPQQSKQLGLWELAMCWRQKFKNAGVCICHSALFRFSGCESKRIDSQLLKNSKIPVRRKIKTHPMWCFLLLLDSVPHSWGVATIKFTDLSSLWKCGNSVVQQNQILVFPIVHHSDVDP